MLTEGKVAGWSTVKWHFLGRREQFQEDERGRRGSTDWSWSQRRELG